MKLIPLLTLSLALGLIPLAAQSKPVSSTAADEALRAAYEEKDSVKQDRELRRLLGDERSPGWSLGALARDPAAEVPGGTPTVGCNITQTFSSGIPVGWSVVNNAPGNPVAWAPLVSCGESNYTSGSGEAACASSDLQGGGSGLYDTELRTPSFLLPNSPTITLSYASNYQNFANVDFLDVDISTNGGISWTNLLSWNEDHGVLRSPPGEDVQIDLSAFGGESIRLRWHYYDPVGPLSSQDWYAQIDDVAIDCGPAAIRHDLTVGTDPKVCAPNAFLAVAPGTEVFYCHEVENTGGVTLTRHDLVSSEFGVLLSGFPFSLVPAARVFLDPGLYGEIITRPVHRTSEWTAFNAGPVDVVADAAAANVFVVGPGPLYCEGPPIQFNAGIPTDWSVVNNAAGNPVVWTGLQDCGEAGNFTGGKYGAACASSDFQGGGSGLYDTELRTPVFDLIDVDPPITLSYEANYQNFALVDLFDVDISTNGGTSWTNLLSWNEDHGSFRVPPGEEVAIDLSAFAGLGNLRLRWHYYDPIGPLGAQDWYAQIDNVHLGSPSCIIFADGFETGDTSEWTSTTP